MSRQLKYAGTLGLVFTLACSAKVEIGHGEGGAAGEGASAGSAQGGRGGSMQNSGGDDSAPGGASPELPTAGRGGSGQVGLPGPVPVDNGPQAQTGRVDLLLAVDNSLSMGAKQDLFVRAVPELVGRLINPRCVSASGQVVVQPGSPDEGCPQGSEREAEPVRDLHVGVISSSLGSHGAKGRNDVCVGAEYDDRGHLIATVRDGVSSYDAAGYLKWDPDAQASPPGESDPEAFADSLSAMLESVGESGCGYEAQLESVYRFLVDPEPPESIEIDATTSRTAPQGIDAELLAQRSQFLRPDSSVVVVMLTDENDCSIIDESYGWLISRGAPMYRSTSACLTNPNDPCCQSCGESAANEGCAPIAEDAECRRGTAFTGNREDNLNLRCWDQKRRFGLDMLYPIERYVGGFGDADVPNRSGKLVDNPLFHRDGIDRARSLFTLAVIGGVPWQDLATPASLNGDELELMTNAQLRTAGRWPMIVGDLASHTPPSDPFMREEVVARSGTNPITGDEIVGDDATDPLANAINGHEHVSMDDELQYACTFELPEPIECNQARLEQGGSCACFEDDLSRNRPLCQPPEGGSATTTQYYGGAYPSLRELDVARQLGRRSVLGSICPRNTQDDTLSDFGYRPVVGAIANRVVDTLTKP